MIHFYFLEDFAEQAQGYLSLINSDIKSVMSDGKFNNRFNNKFLKTLPLNLPTLLLDDKGLWLAMNCNADGKPHPLKIRADWLSQQKRVVNAGKKNELLLKAAKITPDMTIIDATAGLGHDSIVMAGRGARVIMLEENALIHALLTDAMNIISSNKNWQKLHQRLTLAHTNASEYLANCFEKNEIVDLVYLDPMFPHDSYKSALVNKNMQLLQQIAEPPTEYEETELLSAALKVGKRVIVKRPHDAPFLAKEQPSTQWTSDVIRYDGYVLS